MNCEFNILLSRYHDRELTETERTQVANHLRGCPSCAAELEQLQILSQSLRTGIADVMPRASAEFLARLEGLAPMVERQTVLRFVTRLTAAAAAILVAATVSWAVYRQAPAQNVGARVSLNPEERVVLDPDSAVANATEDASLIPEPQSDFIPQELTGGHP
jgi:anti-sigma factor RsiW